MTEPVKQHDDPLFSRETTPPPTPAEMATLTPTLPRIDSEPMGVWDPSVPAREYHADRSALSQGSSKEALRSAMHFFHHWTAAYEYVPPEGAFRVGDLTHICLFEPHHWKPAIAPVFAKTDGRTKEGKAQNEINAKEYASWEAGLALDAIRVTAEEKDHVEAMTMEIMSHKGARALLSEKAAMREVTGYHTHPATGIRCRSRLDFLGTRLIVDLKTTEDASDEGAQKSIANYDYHYQAASYTEAEMSIGKFSDRADYAWIFVEKGSFHAVNVLTPDEEMMRIAIAKRELALQRIKDGITSGRWPAYGDDVRTISLPKWKVMR